MGRTGRGPSRKFNGKRRLTTGVGLNSSRALPIGEECFRLQGFIEELRRRVEIEGDVVAGDKLTSEWITWAENRASEMDPLGGGIVSLFSDISSTGRRWW